MLSEIIAKMKDNIVIIRHPNGGHGTGIILDNRGIIVTNSHVVEDCRTVGIRTNNEKAYLGRVVLADKTVDYAFIICSEAKRDASPVLSQRNDIKEGETVIAIGHPFGYDFTITKGIISSVKREINDVCFMQTDAAINPGNSGGPLLDTSGEILGINTIYIKDAENLAFAVPIRYVIEAYNNLPQEELWIEGAYCCACGKMNEKEAKYCKHCGDDIQPERFSNLVYEDTGICTSCDYLNPQDVQYCVKCGTKLIISEETMKKNRKKADEIPKDMVLLCPECKHENKGKNYCTKCGAKLSIKDDKNKKIEKKDDAVTKELVITCPGCGHENKGEKFCTKCGIKLTPPDTSK